MGLLQKTININRVLSKRFDKTLPAYMRVPGNKDFLEQIAPEYINVPNSKVYDIGGGSQPLISMSTKEEWALSVVGLDIDSRELESAQVGIYDELIVADISNYNGGSDADLIICQTTLEHVANNTGAFKAIASILKPGAFAIIFTPSRHAWFAKLNLLLPEKIKRNLLFKLFPEKAEGHDGFPAYYNLCSPKEFRQLAEKNSLKVVEVRPYYLSSYFQIFFPLYLISRIWLLLFSYLYKEDAAETFAMVVQRPTSQSGPSSSE